MKHNWEYKKLGDVGTVITGSTPSTKDNEYYSSNDFMFVKPGDIPEGRVSNIFETETYISEKAFSSVCRQLPKDAVLTTCIGNIGKVGILTKGATCNQQINAIIPSKLMVPRYLAYSILSIKDLLNSKKNGPVVPIINKTQFSSFYIPCPILKIQERIVKELDEINGMIEGRKEQIKLLDQLAQSIFYEMFGDPITNPKGWEVKKIKEFIQPKNEIERSSKKFKKDDEIIYIDISSIDRNSNKINNQQNYSYAKAPSRAQQILQENDVLISLVRPNLKNIAINKFKGENIVGSSGFCILRNNEYSHYSYIFSSLLTESVTAYLCQKINGAAYPAIKEEDIKEMTLALPPINFQNEFASKVEMIEEQKKDIENSIKELETLLASRMDYWFN